MWKHQLTKPHQLQKLMAKPSQFKHANKVKMPAGFIFTPIPGFLSYTTEDYEFRSYYVSLIFIKIYALPFALGSYTMLIKTLSPVLNHPFPKSPHKDESTWIMESGKSLGNPIMSTEISLKRWAIQLKWYCYLLDIE